MADYPTTSHTLISILNKPHNNAVWQESWQSFVLNYEAAVKSSVIRAFAQHNWSRVPPQVVQEVVGAVFISFFEQHRRNAFDATKGGRIRSFMKQLSHWRVVDYIRIHAKHFQQEVPLELSAPETDLTEYSGKTTTYSEVRDLQMWETQQRIDEQQAFQRATLANLMHDVSRQVSPRSYIFFCEVKLEGRNPVEVAREYDVGRHIVDNDIYKVMNKLRDLARHPDYLFENMNSGEKKVFQ